MAGAPTHARSSLWCWAGVPAVMTRAHRHDDLEVNVALGGTLTYVLGGRVVTLPAGSTALFWAAIPHQLMAVGEGACVHWLTVPLRTVLGFGLPEQVLAVLLRGEPVTLLGSDPQGLAPSWPGDFAGTEPELRAAALLEVHAWLRRRTLAARRAGRVGPGPQESAFPRDVRAATAMARAVAVRFREPLTVPVVAAAVGLSPGHAMTVFRRVVGTTLGAYLAQCRVAEAQRLLVTTDATVIEVATRAGFASQSAFYASFSQLCREAPGAYRARMRHGLAPDALARSVPARHAD